MGVVYKKNNETGITQVFFTNEGHLILLGEIVERQQGNGWRIVNPTNSLQYASTRIFSTKEEAVNQLYRIAQGNP